jgi:hypothetical protein
MKYFFSKIKTEENQKRIKNYPEAGSHMMVSDLYSKAIPEIEADIYDFTETTLKISKK